MTSVEDIERAVAQLAPHELARFRAWFETFDAVHFGPAVEQDARAGILAVLVEEAATSSQVVNTIEF